MPARYSPPPPKGYLSFADLVQRWPVTDRTIYAWLRKGWLRGRRRGGRWQVAEAEADRWEREHPRLGGAS